MTEGYKYIRTLDGNERPIEFAELNQLKKDILWIFDENTGQLNSSFVPDYSFKSKYWEYLTLDGDKWFYEEERNFYKQGVLIIILCMTVEYIDPTSGNQQVFGDFTISSIIEYINNFEPVNLNQQKLKDIVNLGLAIANSMTEADLKNTDGYEHNYLDKFYAQINWVDTTFIKSYFQTLAK